MAAALKTLRLWNVTSKAFEAKYGDRLMTVEAEDEYDARYVASRLSSWPMSSLAAKAAAA